MVKQIIVGSDVTRTALLTKINDNFTDLYDNKLSSTFSKSTINTALSDDKFAFLGEANVFTVTQYFDGDFIKRGSAGNIKIDGTGAFIKYSRAGGNYIQATDSSGSLWFGTGGRTQDVGIDSNGNIGIGTTTPGEKLDVNGKIKATNGGQNPLIMGGYANNSSASSTLDNNSNNTFLLGGGSLSDFYVYWKDNDGNKWYSKLAGTAL